MPARTWVFNVNPESLSGSTLSCMDTRSQQGGDALQLKLSFAWPLSRREVKTSFGRG